jgi:hypothetical protein
MLPAASYFLMASARPERRDRMSEQNGPLGAISEWSVSEYDEGDGYSILVILRGNPGDPEETASAFISRDAQHLRDFAASLNRHADLLEGKG